MYNIEHNIEQQWRGKRVLRVFFKLFIQRLRKDRLNNYSAQLAYTVLLSLFPMLLFIGFILLQFQISADPVLQFVESNTSAIGFSRLSAFVQGQIQKAHMTLLSPIFMISLVTISFGVRPLIGALNHIYNVQEHRTWIRNFFISLIGTICLMTSIVGAVILFLYHAAFQGIIMDAFPVFVHFQSVFHVTALIVLLSSVYLFLVFAYTVMPAKRYRMLVNLRAALYGTILWFLFSIVFFYYVTYLNQTYNIFYGSLGSIIALITWFYFSSIAILIGLEIEIIFEQMRFELEVPDIENQFLVIIDKGVEYIWKIIRKK